MGRKPEADMIRFPKVEIPLTGGKTTYVRVFGLHHGASEESGPSREVRREIARELKKPAYLIAEGEPGPTWGVDTFLRRHFPTMKRELADYFRDAIVLSLPHGLKLYRFLQQPKAFADYARHIVSREPQRRSITYSTAEEAERDMKADAVTLAPLLGIKQAEAESLLIHHLKFRDLIFAETARRRAQLLQKPVFVFCGYGHSGGIEKFLKEPQNAAAYADSVPTRLKQIYADFLRHQEVVAREFEQRKSTSSDRHELLRQLAEKRQVMHWAELAPFVRTRL